MLSINTIIGVILKKQDISCNTDIFDLLSVGYETDIKMYKECIGPYLFKNKTIEKIYVQAKNIKNKIIYLINTWKWNKSVNYNMDTDFYLNKLDTFHKKYKITLLENNTRYEFRLSDLVNYWIESLNNSQGLFSKPLVLKNPHTNLTFSKHNLYNIYFKLLDSGFIMPTIITNLFYSNMNEKKFSYDYYHSLKANTITNFMTSNFVYEQWEQILNMLHDFREDIDYITFRNSISYVTKQHIWKKFKNITLQYLNYKYSCNPLLSSNSKKKTKRMLVEYIEKNPNFGYTGRSEVMRFIPYDERPIIIQSLSGVSLGELTGTPTPRPPPRLPPGLSQGAPGTSGAPGAPGAPPTPPIIPISPITSSNTQNRSSRVGQTFSLFRR